MTRGLANACLVTQRFRDQSRRMPGTCRKVLQEATPNRVGVAQLGYVARVILGRFATKRLLLHVITHSFFMFASQRHHDFCDGLANPADQKRVRVMQSSLIYM